MVSPDRFNRKAAIQTRTSITSVELYDSIQIMNEAIYQKFKKLTSKKTPARLPFQERSLLWDLRELQAHFEFWNDYGPEPVKTQLRSLDGMPIALCKSIIGDIVVNHQSSTGEILDHEDFPIPEIEGTLREYDDFLRHRIDEDFATRLYREYTATNVSSNVLEVAKSRIDGLIGYADLIRASLVIHEGGWDVFTEEEVEGSGNISFPQQPSSYI